ncbi:MAG: type I glyceraldehyde-3-phosphate dehydrogenase, partial [Candidatus Ranarchaeia archaeon]
MVVRAVINGFGRIGRLVLRAIFDNELDIDIVGINSRADATTMAYLLKYDSVHGQCQHEVKAEPDKIIISGHEIRLFHSSTPKQLPWRELDVTVVIESTGSFRTREKASMHLDAGAKKVIVTAPMIGDDITIVMGVNHDDYDSAKHHIISNASCTTNCLAPLCYVIEKYFGIKYGIINTIHAVTLDQRLLDGSHRDLRRGRSAFQSIIPTSTGAAHAIGRVIPTLKGKISGLAIRVP